MKEFIEKLIGRLEEYIETAKAEGDFTYIKPFEIAKNAVNELAGELDMGKVSDGYHTFNELYHHRAVLFAVICNKNKELAWKSKLHDTGDMYDGMFIVGIETPEGQATYHYDIYPYWDMFKVKELPKAPKWDGHSPDEAIRRITFLDGHNNGWIPCGERLPEENQRVIGCFAHGTVTELAFYDGLFHGIYEYTTKVIIAWQPLPGPFKQEGAEQC